MAVGSFRLPMGGTSPVSSGFEVRYFDPFGVLISSQKVASGGNAIPPTAPTISLLTFYGWNNPGTNITRDEDIGGIYDTTDGKTYIFITLTNTTGSQPTLYFQKSTSATLTINWGDTTTSTTTGTGDLNITKGAAYAAIGNYTITITCSGGYNLGNGTSTTTLLGSNSGNPYLNSVKAVYLGANLSILNSYMFSQMGVMSKFSCSSAITGNIGAYVFNAVGLDCVVLPLGVTSNIGAYAFNAIAGLDVLSLSPNMIGTIGNNAFQNLFVIQKLILPIGLTGAINANTFQSLYNITSLILPTGLTGDIGTAGINSCYSLRSLTIPIGITSLSSTSLAVNFRMLEYIFSSAIPPTAVSINFLNSIGSATKIYVPDANITAYKTATNWSTYASYIYPISSR